MRYSLGYTDRDMKPLVEMKQPHSCNWICRVVPFQQLKHSTTLFSLSDHYILSREWSVIVDQLQTNYHGRPNGTRISQVWPNFWLWGILIMVGCVLSQLKHSECRALRPLSYTDLMALGLYPRVLTVLLLVMPLWCDAMLKCTHTNHT